MAFEKRESGEPVNKWSDGLLVEGQVAAYRENSVGKLLVLRNAAVTMRDFSAPPAHHASSDGLSVWGFPTVLQKQLAKDPPGVIVRIECLGLVKTKKGQDCWMFDTAVDADAASHY